MVRDSVAAENNGTSGSYLGTSFSSLSWLLQHSVTEGSHSSPNIKPAPVSPVFCLSKHDPHRLPLHVQDINSNGSPSWTNESERIAHIKVELNSGLSGLVHPFLLGLLFDMLSTSGEPRGPEQAMDVHPSILGAGEADASAESKQLNTTTSFMQRR